MLMIIQRKILGKKDFKVICRHLSSSSRKGFGSFHSDDVDELVCSSTLDYQIPTIWNDIGKQTVLDIEVENVTGSAMIESPYGNRLKHVFPVARSMWTFINHGAFGATAEPIIRESNAWRNLCESQPLRFFDRHLLPLSVYSVRRMAEFINCPAKELVPLQNVTSGINSVLNSLELLPMDEVSHIIQYELFWPPVNKN